MNSILNKLLDLERDCARRDAAALRMHQFELARRGLDDPELSELTSGWDVGLDEEAWGRIEARVQALSAAHAD